MLTRIKNWFFLLLLASASGLSSGAEPVKRTIGVLIFDKVLSSDVMAPLEVFGNAVKEKEFADYRVVAIAPEKKPITTEEGIVVLPRYSIEDAPELEVLIVGSAYDMKPVLGNRKLIQFVESRGGRRSGSPATAPALRSLAKPIC
jgi:transcriptional regulator GlxA family with amidase domain